MDIRTQMKLFNAVIVDNKTSEFYPELLKDFSIVVPKSIEFHTAKELANKYGTRPAALTATFYDSKEFVESLDEVTAKVLQIIHYLSTYGGIEELRNDGNVFSMNNGEIEGIVKAKINFINTITLDEAIEKVKTLVQTNIALDSDDVSSIYEFIETNNIVLENINNRELEIMYIANIGADAVGLDTLMRVINYTVTGSTLFINRNLVRELDKKHYLMNAYVINQLLYRELTTNFENAVRDANRYRDILMLCKRHCSKETITLINRALRQSKTKAVPKKFTKIERFFELSEKEQLSMIDNISVVKATQILNANKQRTNDDFTIYTIRNGKKFITDKVSPKRLTGKVVNALEDVIRKHIQSLNIKLPENVDIAMPTSLKRMLGHLPACTKITLPRKSYSVGVYWDTEHVDIDLHAKTRSCHIGWNGYTHQYGLAYSGDMTNTNVRGYAAEYISIDESVRDYILFDVRLFYGGGCPEDMKLMISDLSKNVDYFANNVIYDMLVDVNTSRNICNVLVDTYSSEDEIYIYLLSGVTTSDIVSCDVCEDIQDIDIYKSVVRNQTYIKQFTDDSIEEVIDLDNFDCGCLLK